MGKRICSVWDVHMESCIVLLHYSVYFLGKGCHASSLVFLLTQKKYAKQRLSDEHPKVNSTDSPWGLVEYSLPPKVPLIQPKSEPVVQESKWTIVVCWCFTFCIPVKHLLLLEISVSVVFAVQVKVEKETPIDPPVLNKSVWEESNRRSKRSRISQDCIRC